jgi:hypothetical protein
MITRNLTRRLERLEEELIPAGEPKVIQIVFVDSDGSRELGQRLEFPSYKGAKLADDRCGSAKPGQKRENWDSAF